MNIVICDDDKKIADELYTQIYNLVIFNDYLDNDFNIQLFYSPKEILEFINKNNIDILFLDISMPEVGGFDIAKICYEQYPETSIIFISDYDERVYYSLRFNPFRFLCKKNYTEYLNEALNSAILHHLKKQNHIMIKTDSEYIPIKISRIIFAEKEKRKNYIILHCVGNIYRYRANISDFLLIVSIHPFVKVNSGNVINMQYIESIKNEFVTLSDNSSFCISRSLRADVKKAYIKYMRER